jgi:c-di-GMP-binding flagellar brake protein YcgR
MAKDPRRAYPRRIIAGVDLFCHRVSQSPIPQPRANIGQEIVDISAGGVRLRLTEPVAQGERLSVELKDRRSGESFRARGEVRWAAARRTAPASSYYAGIQFSEVYTPVGQREKFTVGTLPLPGGEEVVLKPSEKRQASRFQVDDYMVTLLRQGTLASEGLKRNLARQILDLSRTGVQLLLSESLDAGCLVRFTLHMNSLGDALETGAEVRWCRPAPEVAGSNYKAGLRFVNLSDDRRKKIDFLYKWFSQRQKKAGV